MRIMEVEVVKQQQIAVTQIVQPVVHQMNVLIQLQLVHGMPMRIMEVEVVKQQQLKHALRIVLLVAMAIVLNVKKVSICLKKNVFIVQTHAKLALRKMKINVHLVMQI